MFRKLLLVMSVVVVGCGGGGEGDTGGANKSSLPETYGHACLENVDCSDVAGASCNGLSGRACVVACSASTTCPTGTLCVTNMCAQTCSKDADCLNGGGCIFSDDLKASFCGYASQAPIGAHCKHDYDCSQGECITTSRHPDGFCTRSCATNTDCGYSDDVVCVLQNGSSGGRCYATCLSPGGKSSCTNESTCRPLDNESTGFCD